MSSSVSSAPSPPPWMGSLRAQGMVCGVAGAIAFSGKAIVAKLMYKLGADPFAVVGMRMLMAFPMFLLMAWWASRAAASPAAAIQPVTRRQWWLIAGLGFSGYYLASTLDFMGLKYISASLERAILYLNPTIVLVLSALWLRQRISARQVAAMLLSYAGVAIVWMHDWSAASLMAGTADPGLSPGLSPVWAITLGSVLVFLSAFSYAVYLMGSGQLVRHMGSMRLVGLASCVASGMAMAQWVIVYVGSHGQLGNVATLPWQAWALSGLNATLCTVVPIWLVMRGVQLVGASVASQVGMIGPLSTIWMAAWWLGEPVTWRLMAGTGAVLAGIVVLARAGRKPADGGDQRQAKA